MNEYIFLGLFWILNFLVHFGLVLKYSIFFLMFKNKCWVEISNCRITNLVNLTFEFWSGIFSELLYNGIFIKILTQYAWLFWAIYTKLINLVANHIERKRKNYEFKFVFAQQWILWSLIVNFEVYFRKKIKRNMYLLV